MAYDYEALERSDEFQKLVRAKRRWVVPATAFFLIWYTAFVLLAGYAEEFMGRQFIWDGVTVGYALALTQFLMVWVLAGWYLRKANRDFDPLEERVRVLAEEGVLPGTGDKVARTPARGDGAAIRDDVAASTRPEVRP
jgi:uncharacterized membrane protein (DUF485 family)